MSKIRGWTDKYSIWPEQLWFIITIQRKKWVFKEENI